MKNLIFLRNVVLKKKFNKYRLDKFLSLSYPKYSRNHFKKCILKNCVFVNNTIVNSPDFRIMKGDSLNVKFFSKQSDNLSPQKMSLDIVYEDKYLLVINKKPSLVVHPGFGNDTGTLLNGLINYYKFIKKIPRAGIIHRLDKDTSGLIIIAKTFLSYLLLKKMMKKREITREYQAIVLGKIKYGGCINAPISRNLKKRTCMTVSSFGKHAITYYSIKKKYRYYTLLKIRLKTGRTHQIRVHMLYIQHPILGDKKYRCNYNIFKGLEKSSEFYKVKNFPRQALHAYKINFIHPITKKKIVIRLNLPKDMQNFLS
ncbi:RluA family pseudouridine synthase [Buchnera aphidicola]|uniref:RluA family pseudouridine synthase n=1 Tax=Buchnera aphidicola TaxID=9 RepID=UPI002092B1B0|nr:RluA family pseudouridine synthase [Buchnera aphidicola]USS94390.1 RluA family pseudouridine synthase [Buchnera aphidicola (Sipha maydis)]